MSVDHYSCDNCGRTFADCSWDATWCDCGGRFCSKECAIKISDESCRLCRKEIARDDELLLFLLKHFNLNRDQAMELYRGK